MTLEETLNEIQNLIDHDPNLDQEARENIAELLAQVSADPTPANLDVLAMVVEKLSDATRYISAVQTIKNLGAEAGQNPAATA